MLDGGTFEAIGLHQLLKDMHLKTKEKWIDLDRTALTAAPVAAASGSKISGYLSLIVLVGLVIWIAILLTNT